MHWLATLSVIAIAFLSMEGFAWFAHKYVMHGWGWAWHESHHRTHEGVFEKNDLFVVVFSAIVIALFAFGASYWPPMTGIATGITLYGVFYSVFHDGLVHQRWPFRWQPHRGYLKRLVQAHRLHHATKTRDGAVSFGFLWAPNVNTLKHQLKERHHVQRPGRQKSSADRG